MSDPAITTGAVRQLLELVDALACEVRELRAELTEGREASPWMTTEEAAAWLKVSRDTLDKYGQGARARGGRAGQRRWAAEGAALEPEDGGRVVPAGRRDRAAEAAAAEDACEGGDAAGAVRLVDGVGAAERAAYHGSTGETVSATDPRSNDELRACIRTGDAPERVLAAFELGRRLGADVAREVALDGEPNSGVRRHWLTILASFGERDAVRVIAEQHAGDSEGEHALHLAMQLGLADAEWLAQRFCDTTEHMQGVLLARDGELVDWTRTVPTLELLLGSDFLETRRNAACRLLAQQPVPEPALRRYAVGAPSEGLDVIAAWAQGPDHAMLLDQLPMFVGREDVGLRELLTAGRRYPLGAIRSVLFEIPQAFPLVQQPIDRDALWTLTDEILEDDRSVSTSWLTAAAQVLASPWTAAERSRLDRWAADAEQWWVDNADWLDDFVVEPVHAAVLEAVEYPPGPWKR